MSHRGGENEIRLILSCFPDCRSAKLIPATPGMPARHPHKQHKAMGRQIR